VATAGAPVFEVMSKDRKGFPAQTQVKRGAQFVHGHTELTQWANRLIYIACALALMLVTAPQARGRSNPQGQSLIGPAEAAATAIITGKPRAVVMDAMSRLGNSQASLPGARPQQCLDMMQDAAFTFCLATESWCKPINRDHAIARARDSLACYRGEKGSPGAVKPVVSEEGDPALRKAEEEGIDRDTKVHPDHPRVGDVPGQPYIPSRVRRSSAPGNPCANINLPGCNNGLR
jgi:hypothetical protein